jgi:multidrug efflux pump subunit AcrA (membrane-fusion protein)
MAEHAGFLIRGAVLSALILSGLPCALHAANTDDGLAAITAPSADISLSFVQAGRVDHILVKEGDKIEADAVVMQQYDAVESAYLDQKKVDLARLELAKQRGAATDLEVEHAKLEVKIAEVRVENMKLKSPIEGFVEKVDVEVGESVQALVEVIRIVRTDPLWIDVHVPQQKAFAVKLDEIANVMFPEPRSAEFPGKVIFIARAADAASDTLRVRIEVPNQEGRPSGEHVVVSFTGGKE